MTPIQMPVWAQKKYTRREDKYRALLAKGFTYQEAARMADNLPQVYGPCNLRWS